MQFTFAPITWDVVNPTARIRSFDLVRALGRAGISAQLAMEGERSDVLVWGRREPVDIDGLRRRHRWVVFDLSDNLLEYPHLVTDAWRWIDRARWSLLERKRIQHFIERFDAVIVGSRWLKKRVQDVYPGPVYVIEDAQTPVSVTYPRRMPFDAVWVGMNNNIEYVYEVLSGIPELGGFSAKIITAPHKSRRFQGSRSNASIAAGLPCRTRFVPWELGTCIAEAAECRVGLAPLPLTDVTRAKTENKLLLYSALGIPFLCSDIPPYRDYLERFGLGRICRTREDWVRGLPEMLADHHFQSEVARRGSEIVQRYYGMDVIARKYVALYEDLMGLRRLKRFRRDSAALHPALR
jgi:hypothetical protein